MIQIEKLNRDQKIDLLHELKNDLGWFDVATICIEDVKDYILATEMQMPDDDALMDACAYVARKTDFDHLDLWHRVAEIACELNQGAKNDRA